MAFFGKKKYSTIKLRKRDIPNGLWSKCPECAEMIVKQQLDACLGTCPKCHAHFPMSRSDRIKLLTEPDSFEEWFPKLNSVDALNFEGRESYLTKLAASQRKTGYHDAISCGHALIGSHPVAFGVMDFNFLGASMGSVVGEKVTRLVERGTAERLPVVLVCTSGGARMYEGMYSLMQMAKTSAALARHHQAGLAYVTILTNPTTAGVMASFASLGDVIMAEPGALIGFAGPRVIKETTHQDLPQGFQRAEFLLEHGLLDIVVDRRDMKATVIRLLDYLGRGAVETGRVQVDRSP